MFRSLPFCALLLVFLALLPGCSTKSPPKPSAPPPGVNQSHQDQDQEEVRSYSTVLLESLTLDEVKPLLGRKMVVSGQVYSVHKLSLTFYKRDSLGVRESCKPRCLFDPKFPPLGVQEDARVSVIGVLRLEDGELVLTGCKLD